MTRSGLNGIPVIVRMKLILVADFAVIRNTSTKGKPNMHFRINKLIRLTKEYLINCNTIFSIVKLSNT